MKCRCHVRAHLDDNKTLTGTINFCPLHASAEAMLGACKSALRALKDNLDPGPMDEDAKTALKIVISQAERKD